MVGGLNVSATMHDVAEEILGKLNERQREVASHVDGPILVLAGAGSGKTRALTHRIAYLVRVQRVDPRTILAVTFTNKATEEMRHRLAALLPEEADDIWISTFHAAGVKMLRRFAPLISYRQDFTIFDDDDCRSIMKEAIRSVGVDEKRFPPAMVSKTIDKAKNQGLDVAAFARESGNSVMSELYKYYQQRLFDQNAVDFGDLLLLPKRLLTEFPEVRHFYQQRLQYLLVDEFQDTNLVQYDIIRRMTNAKSNLLVVGDDDQSIYAFRGATIRNILEFERDFPSTKVVTLDQNYRSTANILTAAHEVIRNNKQRKPKKLWTAAGEGDPITTYLASDEAEEGAFIGYEIEKLHAAGLPYHDVAIFYRTNAQSRAIEEALMARGVPYRIFGGLRFYDRKEIRDILAFLRLAVNDRDDQAFLRVVNVPARGVGSQTLLALRELCSTERLSLLEGARRAQKSKGLSAFVALVDDIRSGLVSLPLGELIELVINRTGYVESLGDKQDPTVLARLENLQELVSIGRQMAKGGEGATTPEEILRRFLERATLTGSADIAAGGEKSATTDAVQLMTLHLAKGLEFPVVFFTGFEQGLVPHYNALREPGGIEEERRLCYVGLTRPMKHLYLTRTQQRGMFSSGGAGAVGYYRDVSEFAFSIPEKLFSHRERNFITGGYDTDAPREPQRQLEPIDDIPWES